MLSKIDCPRQKPTYEVDMSQLFWMGGLHEGLYCRKQNRFEICLFYVPWKVSWREGKRYCKIPHSKYRKICFSTPQDLQNPFLDLKIISSKIVLPSYFLPQWMSFSLYVVSICTLCKVLFNERVSSTSSITTAHNRFRLKLQVLTLLSRTFKDLLNWQFKLTSKGKEKKRLSFKVHDKIKHNLYFFSGLAQQIWH